MDFSEEVYTKKRKSSTIKTIIILVIAILIIVVGILGWKKHQKTEEYKNTLRNMATEEMSTDFQNVYADVVSIQPAYGVYTTFKTNSNYFDKYYNSIVCECETVEGCNVLIAFPSDKYPGDVPTKFDFSAKVFGYDAITYSPHNPLNVVGFIRRGRDLTDDLENEIGDALILYVKTVNESDLSGGGFGQLAYGTLQKDCYENTTLGYGCKLRGWKTKRRSELATYIGLESYPDDPAELVKECSCFYDLYAISSDETKTINVQIMDQSAAFGRNITQSEMDELLPMMESEIISGLEANGASGAKIVESEIDFVGKKIKTNKTQAFVDGTAVYQAQIYIVCGDYIGIITGTTFKADKIDELFGLFYSLYN